ncbi:MAG TPA: RDD family protein [Kineosporiaceae bacterium]|nr:RDD family protein [Kineosporiaceae bacterium]
MVDRRDLGSWLQGPDATSGPDSGYPGQRLGRPQTGPSSLAGAGRRFAGLCIDWIFCLLIARGFFGPEALQANGSLSVVGVLVVVNLLLVGTAGATVGQRLVGIQVERLDGGRPGLMKALIRAVLLGLGIPALTFAWERDRRGLHDLASQTLVAMR